MAFFPYIAHENDLICIFINIYENLKKNMIQDGVNQQS